MKGSIRNVCSWMIASLLIIFGVVRRAKNRAMKGDFILSVYFHKPTKKEFESCVKWLKKNKFTFLSASDMASLVQQQLPFPKGAAILTVDDGWQCNETNIVEVANKYQVPVTIFVSTAPVEEGTYWWSYPLQAKRKSIKCPPLETLKRVTDRERLAEVQKIKNKLILKREAMTIEQIKRIAESEYVTIGGHTHSHPILPNCSGAQVYSELAVSKYKLESWTKKEVACFSYPNGDYGLREIETLKDLNYKIAFCSDPKLLTPDSLRSTHLLPRFGFLEGASLAENICRMVGVWKPMISKMKNPFLRETENKVPHTFTKHNETKVLTLGKPAYSSSAAMS